MPQFPHVSEKPGVHRDAHKSLYLLQISVEDSCYSVTVNKTQPAPATLGLRGKASRSQAEQSDGKDSINGSACTGAYLRSWAEGAGKGCPNNVDVGI